MQGSLTKHLQSRYVSCDYSGTCSEPTKVDLINFCVPHWRCRVTRVAAACCGYHAHPQPSYCSANCGAQRPSGCTADGVAGSSKCSSNPDRDTNTGNLGGCLSDSRLQAAFAVTALHLSHLCKNHT